MGADEAEEEEEETAVEEEAELVEVREEGAAEEEGAVVTSISPTAEANTLGTTAEVVNPEVEDKRHSSITSNQDLPIRSNKNSTSNTIRAGRLDHHHRRQTKGADRHHHRKLLPLRYRLQTKKSSCVMNIRNRICRIN